MSNSLSGGEVQLLYCWRCGEEMPMLDEAEYAVVNELYGASIKATKEYRQQHGLPLESISLEDRFRPVTDAYERMTGFRESNATAIMHHRLSLYGPPCATCGKPLRTPKAQSCMSCGKLCGQSDERQ